MWECLRQRYLGSCRFSLGTELFLHCLTELWRTSRAIWPLLWTTHSARIEEVGSCRLLREGLFIMVCYGEGHGGTEVVRWSGARWAQWSRAVQWVCGSGNLPSASLVVPFFFLVFASSPFLSLPSSPFFFLSFLCLPLFLLISFFSLLLSFLLCVSQHSAQHLDRETREAALTVRAQVWSQEVLCYVWHSVVVPRRAFFACCPPEFPCLLERYARTTGRFSFQVRTEFELTEATTLRSYPRSSVEELRTVMVENIAHASMDGLGVTVSGIQSELSDVPVVVLHDVESSRSWVPGLDNTQQSLWVSGPCSTSAPRSQRRLFHMLRDPHAASSGKLPSRPRNLHFLFPVSTTTPSSMVPRFVRDCR